MQTSKVFSILVSGLALILLAIHTLGWNELHVDTTSILLLVLIILAPLSDLIKKVKFGEFEAEIGSKEIEKVTENLSFSSVGKSSLRTQIHSDIPKLVESDPQLGLAKLRIELEKIIKLIYFRIEQPDFDIHRLPLTKLTTDLAEKRVIPIALHSSIRDVLSLANRAIHGQSIKTNDAERLANLGVKVIAELWLIFRGFPGKAVQKKPISKQEETHYSGAKYKVMTVTPYQDEPYLSTYILDKKGMDELLEGYQDYAEYLVGVELFDPG